MRIPLLALPIVLATGSVRAESIELKPFPEFSAPRAVTAGPHDHFFANYFAINAWSPDNRYLLVLETDIKDKLPDGAPCTLGLVDTKEQVHSRDDDAVLELPGGGDGALDAMRE